MKIEIGESLVMSYLKHVELCKIVQSNWRVSGNWVIGKQESELSRNYFDQIKKNELLSNIFKENSFDQLIKQSEIDVIGINTLENTVYAYDVAFHSLGLNYKGNEGTCEVVIKKIIRSIFTLQIYFPEFQNIESFFVTPKSNNKLNKLMIKYLNETNKILGNDFIKLGFLSNDSFFQNIVDPVINSTKNENDTSELYLRSVRLNQLDKRVKENKHQPLKHDSSNKRTINGMKIGQYIKNSLHSLSSNGRLIDSDIFKLEDPVYCKKVFKIGFPVLIKNTRSKKDGLGFNRYYKDEIVKGYWLCSQWIENQWDDYLNWKKNKL